MPSKLRPTTEQQAALEAFASTEDLVITAGAGTGKTSTLAMLARSRPSSRGLYLAFNKSIATEAGRSFPSSVRARTAHSVAFGWARGDRGASAVLDRLNATRRSPDEAIDFLGLGPIKVPTVAGEATFTARAVYRWVTEMVTAFQQSADPELDPQRHLPHVPGVTAEVLLAIGQELAVPAERAWAEMIDPSGGVLPVSHATYLKLWGLARPTLPGDYLLFDEAQDASPVIADVLTAQGSQRVLVGDPAQAIYRFTGAVDAMATFQAPHRLQLSRSWRFGEQAAAAANSYLGLLGLDLRLTGNPHVQTEITDESPQAQAVLCRGNAMCIAEAMAAQSAGLRVHIAGGVSEPRRFVEAAEQLMTSGRCSHPELAYFASWEAVREHVEDDGDPGLRTLVNLVDEFGVATLQQVLNACTDREEQAHILVSTVHKAKGREWERVDLGADLDPSQALEDMHADDPQTRAKAMDELRVGYVAVTRACEELGAGIVADALAGHGFPTALLNAPQEAEPESFSVVGGACSSEPARLISGNVERTWVEVPISTDLWQQLLDACDGVADVAAVTAGMLLEQPLEDAMEPAAVPRSQPAAHPTPASSQPAAPAGGDWAIVADETLGTEAAEVVRAWLDQALESVVEATGGAGASRAGWTDEALMDLFEHAVNRTGLLMHRSRGRSGYALTTEITGQPVRLSGSNFGPGYSGPAVLRTLRAS